MEDHVEIDVEALGENVILLEADPDEIAAVAVDEQYSSTQTTVSDSWVQYPVCLEEHFLVYFLYAQFEYFTTIISAPTPGKTSPTGSSHNAASRPRNDLTLAARCQ